jgi:cytidylate kinase
LAARKSIIVEGRDIGSVVFPRAELKLFVTASVDVRAARRHAQLGAGSGETLESVKANIERRDYADQHRHESPLKPCADSWVIDTSDRSIEEILSMILARLAKMGAK